MSLDVDYNEVCLKLRYCDICKSISCIHIKPIKTTILTKDNPDYEKVVKMFEKYRLKTVEGEVKQV